MIELRGIRVNYPSGVAALEGIDLAFRRGEFTVLIGPSGAGKSTLLRCLNLLTRPTRGAVRVEGLGELTGRRHVREHRRRTGMIFQQHHLIGRHTALQNVLTGRLGYHPWWRTLWPLPRVEQRLALACLERVGLLSRALERAENLSGGEQQRVGIARALAQQPRLLLADEPVASLDPATARRVLGLLHGICKEDGIGCVLSLHQLDLTGAFADRVVALRRGRVVFDGPPAGLTRDVVGEVFHQVPGAGAPPTADGTPDRGELSFTGSQNP
jgi:phosphonate transport system ATP-binding protein